MMLQKLIGRELTAAIPFVRAMAVETGAETVHIRGEGTVRPLREISSFVPDEFWKVTGCFTTDLDGAPSLGPQ